MKSYPPRALVELRFYKHTMYQSPVLWRRELVVVPFEAGPRCWIKAWHAAGGAGRADGGSGHFTDKQDFAAGATERMWIQGYVTTVRPGVSDATAIRQRRKFIRDNDGAGKVVVIKRHVPFTTEQD